MSSRRTSDRAAGGATWYAAWALLGAFIIAGSSGRWSPHQPGVWAPTLVNPADVVRNVVLYVPFGVFGMLTLRRRDTRGIARVTLIAIIFSSAVEALQLYTTNRVGSVIDIGSAAGGTVIGASLVALLVSPR